MSTPENLRPPKIEKNVTAEKPKPVVAEILEQSRGQVLNTQEETNQGETEQNEREAEAKKKELLERFRAITGIHMNMHPSDAFDSSYTRIYNRLGTSSTTNTPLTILQINFALSFSDNPEVKKLIEGINEESYLDKLEAEKLKEAAVLKGIKILDLGCGPEPTFARTARKLGADVYTVDVIRSDNFALEIPQDEQQKVRISEAEKHVQTNLNNDDAVQKILEHTGGDFDIVTSAQIEGGSPGWGPHVNPPSNDKLKKIAMALLKKGGCFFNAYDFMDPQIKL